MTSTSVSAWLVFTFGIGGIILIGAAISGLGITSRSGRALYCLLIGSAGIAIACCFGSPWSLAKAEAPTMPTGLDAIVKCIIASAGMALVVAATGFALTCWHFGGVENLRKNALVGRVGATIHILALALAGVLIVIFAIIS